MDNNTMIELEQQQQHQHQHQHQQHCQYSYSNVHDNNDQDQEGEETDEPSMFDDLMSRGERLRQLRLLAQADEEERERQRQHEKQQRRQLKMMEMMKVAQSQKMQQQQQQQQQQGVIINESMNLIIEGEVEGEGTTTAASTSTTSSTNLNQKSNQQHHHLSESGCTNSTCTNSCTSSNSSYSYITNGVQSYDRNEFEFIEEGDYDKMESSELGKTCGDDNEKQNDDDDEDDDDDSSDEEGVDKIDILPNSKLRVLRYDSYISHQRYNDDYKHADCHFVDFGYIGEKAHADENVAAQSNGEEEEEDEGWDCLSPPTVKGRNRLIIQQEKHLGKGGLVWDAGVILAEHLIATQREWTKRNNNNKETNGMSGDTKVTKVVELGSGTGVTGMMLAKAVPRSHVYVTDLPDLLLLMQDNVERNFHPDFIIDDDMDYDHNNNDKQVQEQEEEKKDKGNNQRLSTTKKKLTQQDILNMDRGDAAREIPGVLKMLGNNKSSSQLTDADLNALYNDDNDIDQNYDNVTRETTAAEATQIMKQSAGNVAARVLRWGMKEDYQDGPFDVVIAGDVVTSMYDPQALAETLYDLCHEESVVYVSFKRRLSEVHTKFEVALQDLFETIVFVDPITRHRNLDNISIMVLGNKRDAPN